MFASAEPWLVTTSNPPTSEGLVDELTSCLLRTWVAVLSAMLTRLLRNAETSLGESA